jgi:hypothetical protein
MTPEIGSARASRLWRIVVSVAAGVLACGLPLWPIPYARVSMTENPSGWVWLIGAGAAGALSAILLRRGSGMPALCVALGFVLAVVGRVSVETARDPTSHNLWPFEVVIAGTIGFAGGFLGAVVARGVEWLRRPAGREGS